MHLRLPWAEEPHASPERLIMHTRTRHSRTTPRSRRTLVPALLLGLLVALVPAVPAQAHDRLTSSDPKADATLDSAPEEITLTFSAEVQDVGGSVDVLDENGEPVEAGPPETTGDTVTTEITDELAAGEYEVRWRVISSDGHAISDVIPFTVEEGGTASPSSSTTSSAAQAEESPSSDTPEGTTDTADGTDAADEDSGGSSTTPLLLGVGAIVIVLGAGAALLRSRRRSDD